MPRQQKNNPGSCKYLSGSMKRKKKEAKDAAVVKLLSNVKRLDTLWGVLKQEKSTNNDVEDTGIGDTISIVNIHQEIPVSDSGVYKQQSTIFNDEHQLTTGSERNANKVPEKNVYSDSVEDTITISTDETAITRDHLITLVGHEQTNPKSQNLARDPSMWPATLKQTDIELLVQMGPEPLPNKFPRDSVGQKFPRDTLFTELPNGETMMRNWLFWSDRNKSMYCFPCRVFSKLPMQQQSLFSSVTGFGLRGGHRWKKMKTKADCHSRSSNHRTCYMAWRTLLLNLRNATGVNKELEKSIMSEVEKQKEILDRILRVSLFLAERNLPFRGSTEKVGFPHNGNFLAVLELLSVYDPVLMTHLHDVQKSQKSKKRMQTHYLSPQIQNEFLKVCAKEVTETILMQVRNSKYYGIILDGTPDTSHTEQISFVLRYVHYSESVGKWIINERFVKFLDFEKKHGHELALLAEKTIEKCGLDFLQCRAQTYDNASNMAGQYEGCKAHILRKNPLALFTSCAAHNLNLAGQHAAATSIATKIFFGNVQLLYNIFSSSPSRWKILKEKVQLSLHSISVTRWAARKEAIVPIVKRLPKVIEALECVQAMQNLTHETLSQVISMKKYFSSFESILLITFWYKVLTAFNDRSVILQRRNITLDEECLHIEALAADAQKLRDAWPQILCEAKSVAKSFGIEETLPEKRARKRKKFDDEFETDSGPMKESGYESNEQSEEKMFRQNIFYPAMDSISSQLEQRFEASKYITNRFCVLWKYNILEDQEIKKLSTHLADMYKSDLVADELYDELRQLKSISSATFGAEDLTPLLLLNKIYKKDLQLLFTQVCTAIRLFCTLPVTSAEAERSFSKLKIIKNYLRSTMGQERVSSLATLSIEADIAKKLDFRKVIDSFAQRKARKV